MSEAIDIQEAFDRLTFALHQLQDAFDTFAGFTLAQLAEGDTGRMRAFAESFSDLAERSGRDTAAIGGKGGPNPHLAALASAMESAANGEASPRFGVIEGGKSEE